MFRPVALFIGARYTRAKRRNHFISFIAASSMIGIALGVAVLITVLSVMNGFDRELKERVLGMAPHATITSYNGLLHNWQPLIAEVKQHPKVLGVAPYVSTQGMLRANGVNYPVWIQGVDPKAQAEVSIIDQHLNTQQGSLEQSLKPGEFGMVIGQLLAERMGVEIGDKITLLVAEGTTASIAGIVPRLKRFTLVNTFKTGSDVDTGLALIQIEDASVLLRYENGGISGLRLKVQDLFQARQIAEEVAVHLGGLLRVSDWTQTHGSLFQAVKMEKTVMFVILLLIVAVAAFNIVSTLVMVVTDKQADIAILRTLVASPAEIMGIFIVQGSINGFLGTLFGTVLGVTLALSAPNAIAWIEQTFGIQFLNPDVYFISYLPSELHWDDVGQIVSLALLMSLLATLYPAWRASRTQPAEALRYE